MNMEHLTNYQNYEIFKYYKKIIKGKRERERLGHSPPHTTRYKFGKP